MVNSKLWVGTKVLGSFTGISYRGMVELVLFFRYYYICFLYFRADCHVKKFLRGNISFQHFVLSSFLFCLSLLA